MCAECSSKANTSCYKTFESGTINFKYPSDFEFWKSVGFGFHHIPKLISIRPTTLCWMAITKRVAVFGLNNAAAYRRTHSGAHHSPRRLSWSEGRQPLFYITLDYSDNCFKKRQSLYIGSYY